MDDAHRPVPPQPQPPPGSNQGQYTTAAPPGGQVPAPPPPGSYAQVSAPQYAGASNRTMIVTSGLALIGITLIGLSFLLGGEVAKFMMVGIQFIPLAVLGALAYAGLRNRVAAGFTYFWLALLILGALFIVFFYTFLGTVKDLNRFYDWLGNPRELSLDGVFREDMGSVLLVLTFLLFLTTLLSVAMLFRPVRVLVARIIPIDPDNFVHKIALCFLTFVTISFFLPLIVLNGQPPVLLLMNAPSGEGAMGEALDISVRPQDLIYQFIWTIPATFVAAGWPIARKFRVMLVRLGFVRPTLFQVTLGIVFGVVLAAAALFVLDPGITELWRAMGWGITDVAAFNRLMTQVMTPLGAVLIGVTAGVGEELAVRGLLQPRIGLIASNLVFTSLHALQYGADALLSVFIIGLILGIIRMRTNTSTSAIVHGVYDFVLVMVTINMPVGQ